jgi:hypothetical protein
LFLHISRPPAIAYKPLLLLAAYVVSAVNRFRCIRSVLLFNPPIVLAFPLSCSDSDSDSEPEVVGEEAAGVHASVEDGGAQQSGVQDGDDEPPATAVVASSSAASSASR